MGRDDELPPLPTAEQVGGVPLPSLLLDPVLDSDERAKLDRALRGAEIVLPRGEDPQSQKAEDHALMRVGCLGIAGVWLVIGPVGWLLGTYPVSFLLLAGALVVVGGVAVHRRRLHGRWIREARRARRLIVPVQDLDTPAQHLLRAAVGAVRDVESSRAWQEGRLADGPVLLQDQRWRIAAALARLTEARRLVRQTGSRLEEHHRMLRNTEQVIEDRVRAVLGYAASVRRLDAALADIDAAGYTDTLDHKLRDSLAALGEDHSLADSGADAEATRTAAEYALQELRHQTGVLRSLTGEL